MQSAVPMTSPPFDRKDPRTAFMVDKVDPRIHFALNCGASSCPPIAVYDAESLAQDLETATEGFLEQSVTLNAETKSVNLSQLFQWYRVDFGKSDKEVLDWIKANGGSSVKAKFDKFEEFVGTGKTTIRYDTYNWGLNSK